MGDFNIIISREAQGVSQQGFGLINILSTEGDFTYKEYNGITEVATDFATTTETYKLANRIFGQEIQVEKVAVYGTAYVSGTDPVTDLTDALNTLVLTNNDWYALVCTENGAAEIEELAKWVEANNKIYGVTTQSKTLASSLTSTNYSRAFVVYHQDAESYQAEGWLGACLSKYPGSITWKWKDVAGTSISGDLNTTDMSALDADNINYMVKDKGRTYMKEGVMLNGEYIDVIRSADFIKARLDEEILLLMLSSDKVPFDNRGISQIVAKVESVLKAAYNQGIIAEENGKPVYSVSAPTRTMVSAADRANRHLPDVKFTATIAGAIHSGDISGVIQV